jgi:hypothetical protein
MSNKVLLNERDWLVEDCACVMFANFKVHVN